MSGMDRSIRKFPYWMILILWFLVCVVGLHFLADNGQHASMPIETGFPAGQGANETLDEHQLETSFILPEDDGISSPLALAISVSPDGAFAPLLFVVPLLNPPRA